MAQIPGFIGSSYTSQSVLAAAERTVNWYLEQIRQEHGSAKVERALYPSPGLDLFSAAVEGVSPGRGLFEFEGRCFAVIGSTLYDVDGAGNRTVLGTVLNDGLPVTWQTNGDLNSQVVLTSGGALYCLDLLTSPPTLTAVSTMASGVRMVDYLDGYFFALLPETSTIRVSDLGDGQTWNALRIRERSLAPDRWQAILVPKGSADVWAFGSRTTDVLYNTGQAPVPIAPRPGVKIGWGIRAPFSARTLGGSPIWLGQSEDGPDMVLHADGYVPRRVSSHAVETALQSYPTTEDGVGFTYQQAGHTFYCLTFPTAQHTWVYDAAAPGHWHEREYLDPDTGIPRAWRAQFHAYVFNRHLVLDREGGGIYSLNLETGTDIDGAAIVRTRETPHVEAAGRPLVFLHELAIDLETGVGTATGQGQDPVCMLQVSHDSGRTWGPKLQEPMGRMGERLTRVSFGRLGSGRSNVFRFTVSDPVPQRLIGADLQATRGTGGTV